MNFVTYALAVCIIGTNGELCSGPYPAPVVFTYKENQVDKQGRPPVYAECVSSANTAVANLDEALKQHGLEAFVIQPAKACRVPLDGTNGKRTLHHGRGA